MKRKTKHRKYDSKQIAGILVTVGLLVLLGFLIYSRGENDKVGLATGSSVGSALRIEAEAYSSQSSYTPLSSPYASGGVLMQTALYSRAGTLQYVFSGQSGIYDLYVGSFDENDGISKLEYYLNGAFVSTVLFAENLGSSYPSSTNSVRKLVGTRQVNTGDTIKLVGYLVYNTKGEHVPVDYIEFVPVQVCGNGIIEQSEVCDGETLACTTSTGYSGTQSCNVQCSGYNPCISPQFCGDGAVNGNEVCDGANLAGQTCTSQGFTGGTLGCNSLCTGVDTAQCTSLPDFDGSGDVCKGKLATSTTLPVSDVLVPSFDSTQLNDGDYIFRLVVENNNGVWSDDLAYVKVDNLEITYPLNNDVLRAGDRIEIRGKNFLSDKVAAEWGKGLSPSSWQTTGITIPTASKVGKDVVLAVFDSSSVTEADVYTIKITVSTPTGISEELVRIYLDPSLKKGWPVRMPWEFVDEQRATSFQTTQRVFALALQHNQNQDMDPTIKGELTIAAKEKLSEVTAQFHGGGHYYWAGLLEPAIGNIEGDSRKEIVIYKGGSPPKLYVYGIEGSLLPGLPVAVGNDEVAGGNLHYPLVGDVDNDGYDEIVVYNPNFDSGYPGYSEVYAFKGDGTQLPGWPVSIPREFHPTFLMEDMDRDGYNEIIVKSNDAWEPKLTILTKEGRILSQWDLPQKHWAVIGGAESSPAIGNFDDDSDLEIVIVRPGPNAGGVWEGNEFKGWNNEGFIAVYNIDGSFVQGWPRVVDGITFSSPVVGDLNDDGKQEIVVGLGYASDIFPDNRYGGLYVFDAHGNILPGWPVEKGYNFIYSTPALGDLDKNGDLEIVASRLGSTTYVFNHDGTLFNGWPQQTAWNDYYSPVIADVDGDPSLDIVTTAGGIYSIKWGGQSGGLYAFNSDGNPISGFPKATDVDAQAPAVVTDVDGDGILELVASSDFDFDVIKETGKSRGSIYVWEAGKNTNNLPWPMFMHDPQHTGMASPIPCSARTTDCIQFHDLKIVGDSVEVRYSKNFDTCAHLYHEYYGTYADGTSRIAHEHNLFCQKGDFVTVVSPLNVNLVPDSPPLEEGVKVIVGEKYILYHGNNAAISSNTILARS